MKSLCSLTCKEIGMNDKHREFNENDLLERISEGLDVSESDYNKAVSIYTAVG